MIHVDIKLKVLRFLFITTDVVFYFKQIFNLSSYHVVYLGA